MFSDLCPSVYLKRLKIPWEQSRAGSSPVPSNFYNQCLRKKHIVVSHSSDRVRTQKLRTRPKLTSTNQVRKSSGFVFISFNYIFFSRGICDKRGLRETFLPRLDIYCSVANVATLDFFKITLTCFVKYSLQLRKNCVIWFFFLSFLHLFHRANPRDYESLVLTAGLFFKNINLREV